MENNDIEMHFMNCLKEKVAKWALWPATVGFWFQLNIVSLTLHQYKMNEAKVES